MVSGSYLVTILDGGDGGAATRAGPLANTPKCDSRLPHTLRIASTVTGEGGNEKIYNNKIVYLTCGAFKTFLREAPM